MTLKLLLCLFCTVNAIWAFRHVTNETVVGEEEPYDAPAALTYKDCRCQCKPDMFTDGKSTFGNCVSNFRGKRWCFIRGRGKSPCWDKVRSSKRRGEFWSSHACVTPRKDSVICKRILKGGGGIVPVVIPGGGGGGNVKPDEPLTTRGTTKKPSGGRSGSSGSDSDYDGPLVVALGSRSAQFTRVDKVDEETYDYSEFPDAQKEEEKSGEEEADGKQQSPVDHEEEYEDGP